MKPPTLNDLIAPNLKEAGFTQIAGQFWSRGPAGPASPYPAILVQDQCLTYWQGVLDTPTFRSGTLLASSPTFIADLERVLNDANVHI